MTKRVKRRPGASPLLFGRFLLELGAFVSLEDISDALPPYQEEVIPVEMDAPLASPGIEVQSGGIVYTIVGTATKADHIWWVKDDVLYWVANTLMYEVSLKKLLTVAISATSVQ